MERDFCRRSPTRQKGPEDDVSARHAACKDAAEYRSIAHVRGAPRHPQTQGKIERWHQTLKNRILLENYYLPGDLESQIAHFVDHYNNRRYHESLQNLTPADVYFGGRQTILLERERIKRDTINSDDCNITRKPPKLQPQRSQSLRSNTARIVPKHLKTDKSVHRADRADVNWSSGRDRALNSRWQCDRVETLFAARRSATTNPKGG